MGTSPSSFGSRFPRDVVRSKKGSVFDFLWDKCESVGRIVQTVHRTPSVCGRDARPLYCFALNDPRIPLDSQMKLLVGNAIWSVPTANSSSFGYFSFDKLSTVAASGSPSSVEYYGSNIFDLSGVVFICDVLSDLAQEEIGRTTGCTWLELHLFLYRFFEAYFETKDSSVIKKLLRFYKCWSIILGTVAVFWDPLYQSLSNQTKKRVINILFSDVLPTIGDLPVTVTI